MGTRAWTIQPLPAKNGNIGHLSNVSALVLPADYEMPDDWQMPLFPADVANLARVAHEQHETAELLLETMRTLLATVREQHVRTNGIAESSLLSLRQANRIATDHTSRPYRPATERHRTWAGFVESMQALEQTAPELGFKRFTKEVAGQIGSDSARTITRTMQAYELAPTDWPPSTWDATEDRVLH